MITSVTQRCQAIATFRHISVSLMETLAAWTPTSPEMEAKVMFGRHIWEYAQMADALGKRTFELRKPAHLSLPPCPPYVDLLGQLRSYQATVDRVAGLYSAIVPGLSHRLKQYVRETDPILDEPSIDIVNRIVGQLERQCLDALALQREIGMHGDVSPLARLEQAITSVIADPGP